MKTGIEKRIHPRLVLKTKVCFEDEFGEDFFYLYSENISLGGLFLSSDIPLRIGTLLLISFEVPGHKRPVRATAQVARRFDAGHKNKKGMGLKFIGLTPLAQKRIQALCG